MWLKQLLFIKLKFKTISTYLPKNHQQQLMMIFRKISTYCFAAISSSSISRTQTRRRSN